MLKNGLEYCWKASQIVQKCTMVSWEYILLHSHFFQIHFWLNFSHFGPFCVHFFRLSYKNSHISDTKNVIFEILLKESRVVICESVFFQVESERICVVLSSLSLTINVRTISHLHIDMYFIIILLSHGSAFLCHSVWSNKRAAKQQKKGCKMDLTKMGKG